MQMIFDDTTLDAIASMVLDVQARENTSLPVLKAQLAQTEQGIQNMLNDIQQGIFTASTKQRLEELEATKERLTVSILQEELQKPHLSREQILFFLQRFRAIDTTKQEQRQRLIDSFVNAVYVYDDKIILTFNYQDGTETITLDDINGSDLEASTPPVQDNPNLLPFGNRFGFFCFLIFSMILISDTICLIQKLRAKNAAQQLDRLIHESITVRRAGDWSMKSQKRILFLPGNGIHPIFFRRGKGRKKLIH